MELMFIILYCSDISKDVLSGFESIGNPMFIQTDQTPNPNTLKFLPGCEVMGAATAEFNTKAQALRSPLASKLFEVDGISGVFFGSVFISVTKENSANWDLLTPFIIEAITVHFISNLPLLIETTGQPKEKKILDSLSEQIHEIIETKVRPAVAEDGGDIVFEYFRDGVVYLSMKGACSGCPSSSVTLKNGIERMLKHYVPEVKEVQATTI